MKNYFKDISNNESVTYTEIIINKQIEEVWKVFSNFDQMKKWSTSFIGFNYKGIGEKSEIIYNSAFSDDEVKIYKKAQFDNDAHFLFWFGYSNMIPGVYISDAHIFSFEAVNENTTKLIQSDRSIGNHNKYPEDFGKAIKAGAIFDSFVSFNEELKRECEK